MERVSGVADEAEGMGGGLVLIGREGVAGLVAVVTADGMLTEVKVMLVVWRLWGLAGVLEMYAGFCTVGGRRVRFGSLLPAVGIDGGISFCKI